MKWQWLKFGVMAGLLILFGTVFWWAYERPEQPKDLHGKTTSQVGLKGQYAFVITRHAGEDPPLTPGPSPARGEGRRERKPNGDNAS